jgi:hypothetical protein
MIYNQFYRGLAVSKNDALIPERAGQSAMLTKMDNADVFSELGVLRCGNALAVETSPVNEPCVMVTDFDQNVWFFSTTTGKVWKRANNGVYTQPHTNTQGAHVNADYSMVHNVIVYVTQSKVGTYNFTTWTDNAYTLPYGQAGKHPIAEKARRVFIGDGNYLASYYKAPVNQGGAVTYQASAFDIYTAYKVDALIGEINNVHVIGKIGNGTSKCQLFTWDTRADSWDIDDIFYEKSAEFLRSDNVYYILAGSNIYYWSGSQVTLWRVMGTEIPTTKAQMTTIIKGKPYFFIGSDVYTIHRSDAGTPFAIVKEFTANGTINSIGTFQDKIIIHTTSCVEVESTTKATVLHET